MFYYEKTDVGGGNTLELYFKYIQGGTYLTVTIYYRDETSDDYQESITNWKTVIYNLDNNKVVWYVQFYSHTWWQRAYLYVDYMVVHY